MIGVAVGYRLLSCFLSGAMNDGLDFQLLFMVRLHFFQYDCALRDAEFIEVS